MTSDIDVPDLYERLGALGAKMDNVLGLEGRVQHLEQVVYPLAESAKRRAPWWNVVGVVVGILAGLGSLVAIFIALSQIVNRLAP